MKIGDVELNVEQGEKVDEIISDFLGWKSHVLESSPPPTGRSKNGNQFRLNVDDKRYVSIKLAQDGPVNIQWELFNARMREILDLPHYKLIKANNFPLPKWKDKDYIIIDWGKKDRRFHMQDPNVQESLQKNKCELLFQLGQMAAQNFLFGTTDRKKEHFIWDLDDKVLFSIDHERYTENPNEVLNYFKGEIKSVFGSNWYDNEGLNSHFSDSFLRIWNEAVSNKKNIVNAYLEFELNKFNEKFVEKINSGSQFAFQRIMS